MVRMYLEVVGDADEVVRFLGHLGGRGGEVIGASDGRQIPAPEPARESNSPAPPSGGWTEALAADLMADLDPVAKRMALHVWRAGAGGIHRSALCQRAELTPPELRSLLMRMRHALRRFQRERGLTLPRPVVAIGPLRNYCVDPDFVSVATATMFGRAIAL